jgi:hypothetical protein
MGYRNRDTDPHWASGEQSAHVEQTCVLISLWAVSPPDDRGNLALRGAGAHCPDQDGSAAYITKGTHRIARVLSLASRTRTRRSDTRGLMKKRWSPNKFGRAYLWRVVVHNLWCVDK